MTRYLVPLIFGIAGIAVLVSLGMWQVQRLAWKEGVLAEIDTRIKAAPVKVPIQVDAEADRYLPVRASGTLGAAQLRVLVSHRQMGAGYRVISGFDIGGRKVLLDRGFVAVEAPWPVAPAGRVEVIGNVHIPDDRNSATPQNDIAGNMWFARDLGAMAAELGTEPVLVVARRIIPDEPGVTPLPVDTSAIPNDHLEYAVTWFGLAMVWAAMTGYYIWRLARPKKGIET